MEQIVNELYKINKNIQQNYRKYSILFTLLDILILGTTIIITKTIAPDIQFLFVIILFILLGLSVFAYTGGKNYDENDKSFLYKLDLTKIFFANLILTFFISIFIFIIFVNNDIICATIFIIILYPFKILTQYSNFNYLWVSNFKKIVIQNINKIISIDADIKQIKYSYENSDIKNLSKDLIYFVNNILLANTPNLKLALEYKKQGLKRKLYYDFYDKIIIELDNKITIEITEIEIYEKYIFLRSRSSKNYDSYIIRNFEGLCTSSKLPINYNSNPPIFIYYKTLFDDNPNSINLLKTKESDYSQESDYS
ncbi:MAG: hypothetical protein ACP5O4_03365 [bacterium]